MAAKNPKVFVLETDLAHPVEMVWRALTEKELVDQYYLAPLGKDVTGAGEEIYYGTSEQKLIIGTVLTFNEPRLFEHSFRFAGDDDSPDTVVTYALTDLGAGTNLRLEHAGYDAGSQGYADISGGWPIIIDGLKAVLDQQN